MRGLGAPQPLEPPKHVTRAPATPAVTAEQRQLVAVAKILTDQENSQVKVSLVGILGVVLLSATGYLIWGARNR